MSEKVSIPVSRAKDDKPIPWAVKVLYVDIVHLVHDNNSLWEHACINLFDPRQVMSLPIYN